MFCKLYPVPIFSRELGFGPYIVSKSEVFGCVE